MEILAPVGSPDHIAAAVRSGADAVYMGGQNFNARRNAKNFNTDELAGAISYCHARNVKVYIALNTLITDYETEKAQQEIINLAKLGADAVIIQDMAMLNIIKSHVPDMPVHASTQMSVHNLSGAVTLEKMGFKRVVAARELSLAELKLIRDNTALELEVFVHGALCMCVSGQCYMSSMFGQRSANRGLCAQPCRLDFKCNGNNYALSLKDLSAVSMLREIEKIGINSAKIEGRMKRPEYVAAATHACALSLAGLPYDKDTLQAVFSRSGFTNGYLEGKITRDMFGHRTKDDVISAAPILKKIASQYRKEAPLIGVDMHFEIKRSKNILLTVTDGNNIVKVQGAVPQIANTLETDRNAVEKSLKKCGSTPFFLNNLSCKIDKGLSVSASELNNLRRSSLEKLLIIRSQPHPYTVIEKNFRPQVKKIYAVSDKLIFARFENINQIFEYPDKMIIDYEKLADNAEICKKYKHKIIAQLPPIMYNEKSIDSKLALLKSYGIDTLYISNIYGFEYAKKNGFKIMAGFGLNITNSLALKEYTDIGVDMAEISFECTASRFDALEKPIPCGLIAYGKMPLMTFRACPARTENGCGNCNGKNFITDRYGNKMPLICHNKVYSQLLNPQPIYMGDKLDQIKSAAFVTLYFTNEQPSECIDIYRLVKYGKIFNKQYTRGLNYKEVL